MAYRELMRRKLLEQMYDKMSDEEKRLFVQLTMLDRDHREIMEALQRQRSYLESIKSNQQTFGKDFVSNLAATATWDALLWIGRKLFKLR